MARLLMIPALLCVGLSMHLDAQAPVAYEVVSIKRNTAGVQAGGGLRYLPDGTMIMTNQPIRSIILGASPVPVREVIGLPDWAMVERYDVTAKPPADAPREQRGQMMRTLFAERMKLVAHVEERERDTFALVLARPDGRLGPQLKPSTVDCSPRPAGAAPAPPPPPPAETDIRNRCGMSMSATSIVSGGLLMDSLVQSLSGLAGGLVSNKTGLKGFYALELNFSRSGLGAADDQKLGNEPPEFVTALQEQLGLKLQPEKTMVPVLVVDSIERPSEN
jgi:uncharacterized protein (TIGR03435 family)